MTKKRKRIALVLVYMLLVIGGVNLTDFAQSHAYFTTNNKENPLKYQANVISAYQETQLYLDSNRTKTKTQAPFIFMFDINKGVNTKTQDKYTVTPPTNCQVNRIYGSGSSSKNSNSITLPALEDGSNKTYREGSLTVEMTCELIIGQNRDFKASVTETVKGKTFKYADTDTYKLIYSEYSKDISTEVDDSYGPVVGTEIELFEEFKIWITNYAQQYYKDYDSSNKALSEYIIHYAINTEQGIFKNHEDFKIALDIAKEKGIDKTSIPGISISYDSKKKAYTFKAEANLLGYARTYYSSLMANPLSPNFIFYFDSKNKDVINEAFDYYLEKFIYTDGTVNIETVKKYINSQSSEGVAGLVLNGTKILGMGKIGEGYYITKNDVIEFMNATYPVVLKYDTVRNMINYVNNIFSLKPMADVVSPEVIKDVLNNPGENRVFFEVLLNGTKATQEEKDKYSAITDKDGNPITFYRAAPQINYFVKYDEANKQYVLFTIWSDGSRGNSIKVDTLKLPEGFTVEAANASIEFDGVKRDGLQLMFTPPTTGEYDYNAIYADIDEQLKKILGVSELKESLTAASTHRHRVRVPVDPILVDLNANTVYTPLIDMTINQVSVEAKKPVINTEPVIPPLEMDETSDKENNKVNSAIDAENSCQDGETGIESINPDKEESNDEYLSDESGEEKIKKVSENTKTFPNDNISNNPNKEEDIESSSMDNLPKIK